ncbi:MAG: head GIN domain-containing protein, partial [Hyphococcus sp.]
MTYGKFLALSGAAAALMSAANAETYQGIDSILISEFTGRIIVDIAAGETTATLSGGDADYAVDLAQDGAVLSVIGEERPRNYRFWREIKWDRYGEEALAKYLEDYPTLRISAPAGIALELEDAITIASVGDLQGALVIGGGFVEAVVGDVNTAKVSVHSAGDITLGDVRDDLKASIHGSGDIHVDSAGASRLSIHGSGDIRIGEVRGDAVLKIHGSGDIETGDIKGAVETSIHGSGDISAGLVEAGGDFAVYGSGDTSVQHVNGPVDATIHGSGDIE